MHWTDHDRQPQWRRRPEIPDGNTVSFSWSGGFVGGSATGQMPSVQFPGPTAASPNPVTFPVNLTVADSATSTMCSTTAKIQDTTAPVIAITQPASTTYVHSATLTLDYWVTDPCTGVKSFTPTMDGSSPCLLATACSPCR